MGAGHSVWNEQDPETGVEIQMGSGVFPAADSEAEKMNAYADAVSAGQEGIGLNHPGSYGHEER